MTSNSVFHEFEVDKAIITDLIHSQNGTISTALRDFVRSVLTLQDLNHSNTTPY